MHGTQTNYSYRGCRCDECRVAHNAYIRDYRRRRRAAYVYNENDPHGTNFSYQANGCRCDKCCEFQKKKAADARVIRTRTYQEYVDQFGSACNICGRETSKRLNIDHDHKTGRVRGLLCHACNTGLGKLGDNTQGLLRAMLYLRRDA